jgi:hypothetical protein
MHLILQIAPFKAAHGLIIQLFHPHVKHVCHECCLTYYNGGTFNRTSRRPVLFFILQIGTLGAVSLPQLM